MGSGGRERSAEEQGPAMVVDVIQNGGDGGGFGGGVSVSVIVRPPHCVTVMPVHSFFYCIFIV